MRRAGVFLICALVVELAYRALTGAPVFTLTNWRNARVVETDMQGLSQYDPVLGWITRPNLGGGMATIAYGIRKNQPSDSAVRTGGVLVVGNSFAAGSDVVDDETWPAHLERIIGEPVLNAGHGGYGVDQMVLLAERLVPIAKPKAVVAAIQYDMPIVNQYRTYAVPKPYFVVEHGALVQKNSPVPSKERPADSAGFWTGSIKDALGYSYVVDRVAMKAAPQWWGADDVKTDLVKVENDGVDISCRLLARLKADLDTENIRLVVLLQENGHILIAYPEMHPLLAGVVKCAREQGIQIIDTHARLRPIAERSREEFDKLFVMGAGKDAFGHHSSAGNRLIAEMVAEALHAPSPRASLQ